MFKEFFLCPECGKPVVAKEDLKDCTVKFCTYCGKEMADAVAAASAEEELFGDFYCDY